MKNLAIAAAALLAAVSGAATLPHIFGNDMVLQRGVRVPVWGKGEPGERVTVSFAGQEVSTVTDGEGKWKLWLEPLETNAEPADFRVSGNDETVLHGVVVGEVWFCSGQSNMEFPVGGWLPWDKNRMIKDADREIAAANYPLLRHFKVARKQSETPLDDVGGMWEPTTPESVVKQSAVAYTFGETLFKLLGGDVPVGLINSSWGGTRIEPWTPAGHPDDLWLLQNLPGAKRPVDRPTVLWNGMVSGLVPFAIRGSIWYQGCANRMDGAVYLDKTVAMVRGWRREWGQGDFPYFIVQLAPYSYGNKKDTSLALIQEAQSRVETAVPNSGYTVINDVGNVNDIHPTDKRPVGERLAWQALDRVYGTFVHAWKSPVAREMKVEGSGLRISFDNADGLTTRDGLAPTEFEIRDIVGKWVPATAKIEGSDVVLSAPGIDTPLGVRFAPYNGSTPNLVNGDGLPAGPFRLGAPCPLGAAEKVPSREGYKCIQRYDIPANCDMTKNAPPKPARFADPSRVGYLLELQDNEGDTSYVFAEMDAYSSDSAAFALQGDPRRSDLRTAVSNLSVRTNTSGKIPEGVGKAGGFVEFYFSNYSPATTGEPAGGDTKKYDIDDTPVPNATKGLGYGCLQVHDIGTKTTVLAFNHFNSSNVACDLGIGKGTGENPDWTFIRNGGNFKARRISVWVK